MECFNDFQNIVRSDNLTEVIEKYHIRKGRECIDDETRKAMRDVLSILDSLKTCGKASIPWILKFAKIISTFSPSQFSLFIHIIGGGQLIQYAISEGISEQAAHQMWWRLVRKNPELKDIYRRRFCHDNTRQSMEGHLGSGSQKA